MKTNFEKQNEEALVNAFKMEVLEERLEMVEWHVTIIIQPRSTADGGVIES